MNQSSPTIPITTKMAFQLRKAARIPSNIGETIPPIAAPELKIPWAKARSLVGNHSALAFAAPGQFPASATPRIPRKIAKLIALPPNACSAVAIDQTPIDRTNPILVPSQSKSLPKIKYVYFEHHYDDMLKKGYTFSDIHNFLKKNNFKMIFKSKMFFRKTFEYIYQKGKI